MEARMSIYNVSIEAGARVGIISPDQTTSEYLKGRPLAPKPDSLEWKRAVLSWSSLKTDEGAKFDKEVYINAKDNFPAITWCTSSQDITPITGVIPGPDSFSDPTMTDACKRALEYTAAACILVGKLADVRNVASAVHVSPAKASPQITVADPSSDNILTGEDMDRVSDPPEEAGAIAGAETRTPSPSRGMAKFTQLKGIAAPMERANVNTDAIIPKQFLKAIKRSDLGTAHFYQWRYKSEISRENPDFILDKDHYRNAKILVVTGANFGYGSSREHAPWALLEFGIRCIIAPSF